VNGRGWGVTLCAAARAVRGTFGWGKTGCVVREGGAAGRCLGEEERAERGSPDTWRVAQVTARIFARMSNGMCYWTCDSRYATFRRWPRKATRYCLCRCNPFLGGKHKHQGSSPGERHHRRGAPSFGTTPLRSSQRAKPQRSGGMRETQAEEWGSRRGPPQKSNFFVSFTCVAPWLAFLAGRKRLSLEERQ
jgi:hypothetical protein